MFQEQIAKIASQIPGKLGIFPVLAPSFYLSFPKIWITYPPKNNNSGISKDMLIFQKVWYFYSVFPFT